MISTKRMKPTVVRGWMASAATILLLAFTHVSSWAGDTQVQVCDLTGATVSPLKTSGQIATVLFFITNDCPIANSYAPEMERICQKYAPKRIKFYVVYTDSSLKAADARKHKADYGLSCVGLLDTKHLLVHRCGATITPEAAIVTADGALAYRGRIDNRYLDFGKARYSASTHELRDALDAIVAHKSVVTARTQAVGCYIAAPL